MFIIFYLFSTLRKLLMLFDIARFRLILRYKLLLLLEGNPLSPVSSLPPCTKLAGY
jgi:hypothetical protein